jgi:threonine/homoserine/homoserine lactone efflux protein
LCVEARCSYSRRMLAALLSFAAASVLIVLLPGPDTLVVVRGLLRGGMRRGALTAAGVLCGLLVWIVVAAAGLAALLRASDVAYTVLRVIGAAYLITIGIQSLRARGNRLDGLVEPDTDLVDLSDLTDLTDPANVAATATHLGSIASVAGPAATPATTPATPATDATATRPAATHPPARRRGLLGSGFTAGVATDLLNPKVGAFFVTFLPSFVPHGEPVGRTTALLGAIFLAETALYFAALVLAAGRVTAWMADAAIRRRLERGTGAVFIGFGIRLAAER